MENVVDGRFVEERLHRELVLNSTAMAVVQPAHGSAKSVAKYLHSLDICSLLMTSTVF